MKTYKAKISHTNGNPIVENVDTNIGNPPGWIMTSVGLPPPALPAFGFPIGPGEENIMCSVDAENGLATRVSGYRQDQNYISFKTYDKDGNQIMDNVVFYVQITIK